jgi:putative transposase
MYAIKQELQLNDRERTLMARHSGDVRFCYNLAFALDREVKGRRISSSKKVATIARVFTTHIKKAPEERCTKTRSSRVEQMTFRHLGEVLSKVVKVLGGHKLKRKKDGDSSNAENVDWERKILLADSPLINIPSLGTWKLKDAISFHRRAQALRIWHAMTIETEKVPLQLPPVAELTVIEPGESSFTTLSDGNFYEFPPPLAQVKTKQSQEKWRNHNNQLGNRRLGVKTAKNVRKHYSRFAKIHAKTAKQGREFLRKTATEISQKFALIRREDLPSSGTISARELAAAISDCRFSELRRLLVYKSSMYGTTVELVDRWYPSSKTCSNCDRVRSVPLNERVFECENCCAINRGIQVAIDLARHEEAHKAGQVGSVKPADKKEATPLQAAVREP